MLPRSTRKRFSESRTARPYTKKGAGVHNYGCSHPSASRSEKKPRALDPGDLQVTKLDGGSPIKRRV